MRNRNLKNILSMSARILLASVFVFGQTAWAGQNHDPKAKQDPTQTKIQQPQANSSHLPAAKAQSAEEENTADQKTSSDGQHEGIKVHGWWTIDVRNSDGTLVAHREFENSVVGNGFAFVHILSRQNTSGAWAIFMEGLGGNVGPCVGTVLGTCFVEETTYPITISGSTPTNTFNNLVLNPVINPNTPGSTYLQLSGTATASQSGTITGVTTFIILCSSNMSPQTCLTNPTTGPYTVTGTSLQSPVNVTQGQTIAVTVNLSFS